MQRMVKKELLDSAGCVPAHASCPFRGKCETAAGGKCQHTGEAHAVPFSCEMAKSFDLTGVNEVSPTWSVRLAPFIAMCKYGWPTERVLGQLRIHLRRLETRGDRSAIADGLAEVRSFVRMLESGCRERASQQG